MASKKKKSTPAPSPKTTPGTAAPKSTAPQSAPPPAAKAPEAPKKPASQPSAPAPAATKPTPPQPPTPAPSQPAPKATAATPPVSAPPKKPASPTAASKSAPPSAQPPAILLEGDLTPTPPVGGPGQRYALAPLPLPSGSLTEPRELPTSYGTRRLLLVARDPHWVYAHWDFTDAQIQEANRLSASGALVLRIRAGTASGDVVVEQPVHPESRNWFIHVPQAGARYVAEIGYYDAKRTWSNLATSAATLTPRDQLSSETWVRFETLPFDLPLRDIIALVKEALADPATPLLDAIHQLRQEGALDLPVLTAAPGSPSAPGFAATEWTPAQERALAEVLSMDEVRRVWIGSLEITELLRRQLQRGLSSAELALPKGPAGAAIPPGGPTSLSSPFGGAAPGPRAFWFNINAEVIVYGATDPLATVTVGDRPIRLRPDGTFTYRFSLPDGEYPLAFRATSPDGVESREAQLTFKRASAYRGDVAAHPQDPALRPPSPQNVA